MQKKRVFAQNTSILDSLSRVCVRSRIQLAQIIMLKVVLHDRHAQVKQSIDVSIDSLMRGSFGLQLQSMVHFNELKSAWSSTGNDTEIEMDEEIMLYFIHYVETQTFNGFRELSVEVAQKLWLLGDYLLWDSLQHHVQPYLSEAFLVTPNNDPMTLLLPWSRMDSDIYVARQTFQALLPWEYTVIKEPKTPWRRCRALMRLLLDLFTRTSKKPYLRVRCFADVVFPLTLTLSLASESSMEFHIQYDHYAERQMGEAIGRWIQTSPTTSRSLGELDNAYMLHYNDGACVVQTFVSLKEAQEAGAPEVRPLEGQWFWDFWLGRHNRNYVLDTVHWESAMGALHQRKSHFTPKFIVRLDFSQAIAIDDAPRLYGNHQNLTRWPFKSLHNLSMTLPCGAPKLSENLVDIADVTTRLPAVFSHIDECVFAFKDRTAKLLLQSDQLAPSMFEALEFSTYLRLEFVNYILPKEEHAEASPHGTKRKRP